MADIACEYANEVQRAVFFGENVPAVLRALSDGFVMLNAFEARIMRNPRAPSGYDLDDILKLKKIVSMLGIMLYQEFPHAQSVPVDGQIRTAWLSGTKRPDATVVWVRFVRLMKAIEGRERCLRPGCNRIAVTRENLSYCGGCRRVVYCSTRCQKLAWTHPVAHRHVCAAIKFMYIKYRLPKTGIQGRFSEVPTDGWHAQVARAIINHFVALTKADMETSSELWFKSEAHTPVLTAVRLSIGRGVGSSDNFSTPRAEDDHNLRHVPRHHRPVCTQSAATNLASTSWRTRALAASLGVDSERVDEE
jgi:hypothetical protein